MWKFLNTFTFNLWITCRYILYLHPEVRYLRYSDILLEVINLQCNFWKLIRYWASMVCFLCCFLSSVILLLHYLHRYKTKKKVDRIPVKRTHTNVRKLTVDPFTHYTQQTRHRTCRQLVHIMVILPISIFCLQHFLSIISGGKTDFGHASPSLVVVLVNPFYT